MDPGAALPKLVSLSCLSISCDLVQVFLTILGLLFLICKNEDVDNTTVCGHDEGYP